MSWLKKLFGGGTEPQKPSVVLDESLKQVREQVAAPWLGYALNHSNRIQKNPSLILPGEIVYQPSFEEEVTSRKAMVKVWAELKEKDSSLTDQYLDELLLVERSGFLREYVWKYLRLEKWGQEPTNLKMEDFLTWGEEHLKHHTGRTLAHVKLV